MRSIRKITVKSITTLYTKKDLNSMKKLSIITLSLLLIVSSNAFAGVRFGDGTKTITTAGTALALTSTSQLVTTLWVCGDSNNSGKIVVGVTPVATAGAQEGIVLAAGACASIYTTNPKNAFDISLVKADVTVSGEEVSYYWTYEEN